MPESLTQIRCPNCKAPIQAHLEQIIDVHQDPASKARLLSGGLNHVRCSLCGFEGQIAAPLVYHDPEKELLLTYIPMELNLSKDDQERTLGRLINRVVDSLPPEARKAYLLQPQAVLTMQGLIERILEADGITREQIEAQQAKMRLFEALLRTPEDQLEAFVAEHDAELDEGFFQLASMALQSTGQGQAREAAAAVLGKVLSMSSFGKELRQQEAELRAASESLRDLGDSLDRQTLVELFIQAPNEARLVALANLTRPALDYAFFQLLSERIDAAQGEEKERLEELRSRVLELTQEIDKIQEARAAEAASLLKRLAESQDLDGDLLQALPLIDELFLSILQANLMAARERDDQALAERLEAIDRRLQEIIRSALPPGVQLAQRILAMEDVDAAEAELEASADSIDEQFLGALLATAQSMEQANQEEAAQRVRRLHRTALRIVMRRKMAAAQDSPGQGSG